MFYRGIILFGVVLVTDGYKKTLPNFYIKEGCMNYETTTGKDT
jgi:hypothetical protein